MHMLARAVAPFILLVLFACSPAGPTTPPEGSAERDAIFAAMRQGRDQGADLVFITSHFLVQGDWAWVTANPQSKDGSQHYETESWLLQKTSEGWRVAAQPCAEEGCEPAQELAKIRSQFPQAPAAIFPT